MCITRLLVIPLRLREVFQTLILGPSDIDLQGAEYITKLISAKVSWYGIPQMLAAHWYFAKVPCYSRKVFRYSPAALGHSEKQFQRLLIEFMTFQEYSSMFNQGSLVYAAL